MGISPMPFYSEPPAYLACCSMGWHSGGCNWRGCTSVRGLRFFNLDEAGDPDTDVEADVIDRARMARVVATNFRSMVRSLRRLSNRLAGRRIAQPSGRRARRFGSSQIWSSHPLQAAPTSRPASHRRDLAPVGDNSGTAG